MIVEVEDRAGRGVVGLKIGGGADLAGYVGLTLQDLWG